MYSFLKYLIFWSPFKINSRWEILDYKWRSENIIIPEEIWWVKIIYIWNWAFYRKGISNIILPKTLKEIWSFAFRGNNIKNLYLPKNIKVWYWAFIKKENIEKYYKPYNLPYNI